MENAEKTMSVKEKKDLANAISIFIKKHWVGKKLFENPECVFKVVEVTQVQIDEDSLEKFGNDLFTFEGSACISYRDKSNVTMSAKCTIKGNATVVFYPNGINSEENLPEIKNVEITKTSKA